MKAWQITTPFFSCKKYSNFEFENPLGSYVPEGPSMWMSHYHLLKKCSLLVYVKDSIDELHFVPRCRWLSGEAVGKGFVWLEDGF